MGGKFKFDWTKTQETLTQETEKKKGYQRDERFWKNTVDKDGNGTAIIRFLPDTNGTPWVKYYAHNFNYMLDGVKKYWIRNCINTFGYDKECPICKKNQEYWNSAFESDKSIASQRKRKLIFVSNILVVKNPANPEDEDKTFLFNFGEKIFNKIKDKMQPSPEVMALGEYDQYMPVDLYDGANFKLVQVKQGEFPNYDKSEFGKQGPVGNDKKIDDIMSKVIDLSEFIAHDKFPTNDEVIQKLGTLLGLSKTPQKKENLLVEDELEDIAGTEKLNSNFGKDDVPLVTTEETDDPDEDFFKNL